MSWSFKLSQGDLDLSGPGGFATVTGTDKLIQDLKNWILEPRGTDPFHPDYGSTLDGGTLPDGTTTPSAIGTLVTAEALMSIESETRRILSSYQQQQIARMTNDATLYGGKNTMAVGEVLSGVSDVNIDQIADVVIVNPVLQTSDGNAVSFTTTLN